MRYSKDSQNFLSNPKTIQKLIDLANLSPEDVVLDIGAGTGQLTTHLATQVKQVIAIEKDIDLANLLAKNVSKFVNIEVVCDDFNLVDLGRWSNFKVVSNLPFNYTSDTINRLYSSKVSNIFVIIQKEVAQKYLGQPHETLKSLLIKSKFRPTILCNLHWTNFVPRPGVEVVYFNLKRLPKTTCDSFVQSQWEDFITYVFQQNKPNLVKSLEKIITYKQLQVLSKDQGFGLNAKLTELNFIQWLGLFSFYSNSISEHKKFLATGSYQRYLQQKENLQKVHRSTTSIRLGN